MAKGLAFGRNADLKILEFSASGFLSPDRRGHLLPRVKEINRYMDLKTRLVLSTVATIIH